MSAIQGQYVFSKTHAIEVNVDPSIAPGVPSPIGSIAIFPNGALSGLFQKFGPADTDWTEFDTSLMVSGWALAGNVLSGTEFLGSLNNFDVVFKRNNIEQFRLTDNAIQQVVSPGANPAYKINQIFPVVTTIDVMTATITIPIPNGYAGVLETTITAKDMTSGLSACGIIRTDQVSNVAGTVSKQFDQEDYTFRDDPAIIIDSAPSGTNLVISLTGVAGRTLKWFVTSDITLLIS